MPRWGKMFVVVTGLVAGTMSRARADEADCSVQVVHATKGADANAATVIDDSLERMKHLVVRLPWNQYHLLDTKKLVIKEKTSQTFALPNGKQVELGYLMHMPRAEKHRIRLELKVTDGPRSILDTTFVLDEGGMVLQAGTHYQGGRLILAITCSTKD
jgi:hypothetical protein